MTLVSSVPYGQKEIDSLVRHLNVMESSPVSRVHLAMCEERKESVACKGQIEAWLAAKMKDKDFVLLVSPCHHFPLALSLPS
jgi:hypothetical protein